jgi:hypothetical protein
MRQPAASGPRMLHAHATCNTQSRCAARATRREARCSVWLGTAGPTPRTAHIACHREAHRNRDSLPRRLPASAQAEPRPSTRLPASTCASTWRQPMAWWASTLTSTCLDLRRPASTCVNLLVDATMCGRRQLRRPASTGVDRGASSTVDRRRRRPERARYGAWARVTCRRRQATRQP